MSQVECISCRIANSALEPIGGLVYEDELWVVNHRFPPTPVIGWLILQPRRHVEWLHDLTFEEQSSLGQVAARLTKALTSLVQPRKVYMCLFAESRDCPHIHFHIIPRTGDIEVRGPAVFNYQSNPMSSTEEISLLVEQVRKLLWTF